MACSLSVSPRFLPAHISLFLSLPRFRLTPKCAIITVEILFTRYRFLLLRFRLPIGSFAEFSVLVLRDLGHIPCGDTL